MNPNVTRICWISLALFFSGISRALQSGSTGQGEFEQIYRRLYHVLHKLRGMPLSRCYTRTKKPRAGVISYQSPDC